MKRVCELNHCTGCSACIAICPQNAISLNKDVDNYNCIIDEQKCVNCNLCYKSCQQNDDEIVLKTPNRWIQGWSNSKKLREEASSGGVASEIMQNFISENRFVAACTYDHNEFIFTLTNKLDEIKKLSGSKYIKSDPKLIFRDILKQLISGNKVLFVGLPCQVYGLKKYIPSRFLENLYTIDLICHGSPSSELFSLFLKSENILESDISKITFREKDHYNIRINNHQIVEEGLIDKYTISFIDGLTYTENCYKCRFAQVKRCSDLTLGDSWGSNLDLEEQKKGISLILQVSDKGEELINMGNLSLFPVDQDNAVKHNRQLLSPSRNDKREKFFRLLKKSGDYSSSFSRTYPKVVFRQSLKKFLYRIFS